MTLTLNFFFAHRRYNDKLCISNYLSLDILHDAYSLGDLIFVLDLGYKLFLIRGLLSVLKPLCTSILSASSLRCEMCLYRGRSKVCRRSVHTAIISSGRRWSPICVRLYHTVHHCRACIRLQSSGTRFFSSV